MTDDKPKNPKQRGLGRGLDALFGDDETVSQNARVQPKDPEDLMPGGVRKTLGTAQLMPNPDQPRRHFKDSALNELAESIREHGIIQPILVRPYKGSDEMFEIIAGERRWRASQLAQLHEVPVIIRDMDDATTYQVALIENLQREDLTPIEEANGYKNLIEGYGHTQESVAEIVGKSRSHIANMVRLLTLPASVQNLVNEGKLSAGHARAVAGLSNAGELAREIVAKGMSVRQAEKLAANVSGRAKNKLPAKAPGAEKDHDTIALEKQISDALGLKVSIDLLDSKSGALKIDYKNLDQLDDVLNRLATKPDPNAKKWVF
jgi:ParB family chromosome partitioning protein